MGFASLNPRLIVVAPSAIPATHVGLHLLQGITLATGPLSPDFRSIQAAIDYAAEQIQLEDANNHVQPGQHNLLDRYTILVTPGVYFENIVCAPFVDIVGINHEAVYLIADGTPPTNHKNPTIALSSNVNIKHLIILNGNDDNTVFAISGDNVVGVGITDVEVWAAGDGAHQSKRRALHLGGAWTTVILREFGVAYAGDARFGVELLGPTTDDFTVANRQPNNRALRTSPNRWLADCHFIDCWFDTLNMTTNGGSVYVNNCCDVHFRDTLFRTAPSPDAISVLVESVNALQPFVQVLFEGSTLYGSVDNNGSPNSTGALRLGLGTRCVLSHSSADSYDIDLASSVIVDGVPRPPL